jgi:uncharacterized protein YbjT (DUF2867 family)
VRVVVFGASGMVGAGVLLECLDDPRVASVLAVGRRSCGVTHPKLTEVLHGDFYDYSAIASRLAGLDACFFTLGVSAAGLSEAEYAHQTYDLTLAAARATLAGSPRLTFCYVSGVGTDSTERGRVMWARVKGRTENALLALPFAGAYMLRPGFIQPLRGVRSRTALYRAFYVALAPVVPLLRRVLPKTIATTVSIGRAMIELALNGEERRILGPADIERLAQRYEMGRATLLSRGR